MIIAKWAMIAWLLVRFVEMVCGDHKRAINGEQSFGIGFAATCSVVVIALVAYYYAGILTVLGVGGP